MTFPIIIVIRKKYIKKRKEKKVSLPCPPLNYPHQITQKSTSVFGPTLPRISPKQKFLSSCISNFFLSLKKTVHTDIVETTRSLCGTTAHPSVTTSISVWIRYFQSVVFLFHWTGYEHVVTCFFFVFFGNNVVTWVVMVYDWCFQGSDDSCYFLV